MLLLTESRYTVTIAIDLEGYGCVQQLSRIMIREENIHEKKTFKRSFSSNNDDGNISWLRF